MVSEWEFNLENEFPVRATISQVGMLNKSQLLAPLVPTSELKLQGQDQEYHQQLLFRFSKQSASMHQYQQMCKQKVISDH